MKLARLPDGEPEIFHTIQGEGRNAGLPSVFVRASLCNLYCRWCDTDYTWNWEGTKYRHDRDREPGYAKYRKEEQIVDLSPDEICKGVEAFACRNVVLTGGEPLIQQRDWLEVITGLRNLDSDYSIEVETNGTILPRPEFVAGIDQFNVSPKLKNSGVDMEDRCNPEVLESLAALETADFKFVIESREDLEEVQEIAATFAIPPGRVFLMPQGTTSDVIAARSEWLIAICKQHGFRYSNRLHVRLWGDRRGV